MIQQDWSPRLQIMADVPTPMKTMGELTLQAPDDDDEKEVFASVLSAVENNYPVGWKEWEVLDLTQKDLFGDELSSTTDSKLRFGIPTTDLVRAFYPEAKDLPERAYRYIRKILLSWPITVEQGSGNHLMAAVLQQQMELFNKLVEMQSEQGTRFENQRIAMRQPMREAPPLDDSYESVPDSTQEVEETIPHSSPTWEDDEDADSDCAEEASLQEAIKQTERRLEELKSAKAAKNASKRGISSEVLPAFNFKPHTTESESYMSKADPVLAQQAKDCQRLGTDGWTKMKYKEVQKQFQATPVFTSLKVNNQFAGITPSWSSVTILEKTDLILGAITNGLLQQRKFFEEQCDKMPQKLKQKVGEEFLAANSKFRKSSDDLLQYVCGRRAEIIYQSRNTYKPPHGLTGWEVGRPTRARNHNSTRRLAVILRALALYTRRRAPFTYFSIRAVPQFTLTPSAHGSESLASSLENTCSKAANWCSREKVRHFEVSAMDRPSLYEPFIYLTSRLNPVQNKTAFPQLSTLSKLTQKNNKSEAM
ncbi:unnamed protein product [Chilo suppressalis]|uniref:Uncharacterized protein n=1 Tax=Chilo suppressalis TaxID=168631 RepID=A0ABN8L4U4_CHISP|nr:unnamed protein product [Chilo suppressalis]